MQLNQIQEKIVTISDKYARVHEINRTDDRYLLKLQEEMGELTQSYISFIGHGRNRWKSPEELKKSFAHELWDVMWHLLLLANHFDIDIDKALEEKWYKYLD